jgi:branched-chain amino acid aminotransferase
LGIEVVERAVDKSELFIADEVFLSGTAAKVAPVKRIEFYELPTARPITDKIREVLTAVTENREPKYQDWVTKIRLDG